MRFVFINPNPDNQLTGDCTVRALSILLGMDWDTTYIKLAIYGFMLKDMPSSNRVWSTLLYDYGFRRYIIPDTCPDCYTINQFCIDNPIGTYLLATGSHVVTVIDGKYYDSWDSGNEIPVYYWRKER